MTHSTSPTPPKSAEQQLDDVFHALPEWIRRNYPEVSVADRVRLGFEHAQQVWMDSLQSEHKNHQATRDFLHHVMQKHNLDFGQEYWNYVIGRDFNKVQKSS